MTEQLDASTQAVPPPLSTGEAAMQTEVASGSEREVQTDVPHMLEAAAQVALKPDSAENDTQTPAPPAQPQTVAVSMQTEDGPAESPEQGDPADSAHVPNDGAVSGPSDERSDEAAEELPPQQVRPQQQQPQDHQQPQQPQQLPVVQEEVETPEASDTGSVHQGASSSAASASGSSAAPQSGESRPKPKGKARPKPKPKPVHAGKRNVMISVGGMNMIV